MKHLSQHVVYAKVARGLYVRVCMYVDWGCRVG